MAGASSSLIGLAASTIIVAIVLLSLSSEAEPYNKSSASFDFCSEVRAHFQPCVPYLTRFDIVPDRPSHECCVGVKDLTEIDPLTVCECIQKTLSNVLQDVRYNPQRMSMIPNKCGFNFTYPAIRQDTDCRKPILEPPCGI